MSRNSWPSLVVQSVKNLPAMQENQVRSLGQEDPLEKEMATYSSILVWKIPWTEEPGRLHTAHGVKRIGHNLATKPPPPLVRTTQRLQGFCSVGKICILS